MLGNEDVTEEKKKLNDVLIHIWAEEEKKRNWKHVKKQHGELDDISLAASNAQMIRGAPKKNVLSVDSIPFYLQ